MSKYISQVNNVNFVYPNYDLAEYDVNIIHNINDNGVTGVVTSFSAVTATSTAINIRFTNTWTKNDADVFIRSNGALQIYTLHAMAAGQTYYKPWRLIDQNSTLSTGVTTFTTTNRAVAIIPSQLGLTTFVTGTYYFEFRFVGLKSVYPVCQTLSLTI